MTGRPLPNAAPEARIRQAGPQPVGGPEEAVEA
jgi:hypothetical protein